MPLTETAIYKQTLQSPIYTAREWYGRRRMKHLTLLTLLVLAAPFGWGEKNINV